MMEQTLNQSMGGFDSQVPEDAWRALMSASEEEWERESEQTQLLHPAQTSIWTRYIDSRLQQFVARR